MRQTRITWSHTLAGAPIRARSLANGAVRQLIKVRERIGTIADLFLGALYADQCFDAGERCALGSLLCELIVRSELPRELELRIARFHPAKFDLIAAVTDFRRDPPMRERRLLELTAQLSMAGGEIDLDKDEYVRKLGRALGMSPTEYEDLVLDYDVQELDQSSRRVSCPPGGVIQAKRRIVPQLPAR